jgi:hypothetical protein
MGIQCRTQLSQPFRVNHVQFPFERHETGASADRSAARNGRAGGQSWMSPIGPLSKPGLYFPTNFPKRQILGAAYRDAAVERPHDQMRAIVSGVAGLAIEKGQLNLCETVGSEDERCAADDHALLRSNGLCSRRVPDDPSSSTRFISSARSRKQP